MMIEPHQKKRQGAKKENRVAKIHMIKCDANFLWIDRVLIKVENLEKKQHGHSK